MNITHQAIELPQPQALSKNKFYSHKMFQIDISIGKFCLSGRQCFSIDIEISQ